MAKKSPNPSTAERINQPSPVRRNSRGEHCARGILIPLAGCGKTRLTLVCEKSKGELSRSERPLQDVQKGVVFTLPPQARQDAPLPVTRPQIKPFTGVVGMVPTVLACSDRPKSNLEGWPDCPLLRASSEHILIVRAARARRAVWPALTLPFFNILLVLQEIKMLRRASAMADRQTVPDGFSQISLGNLHCVGQWFTLGQLCRDGRGVGAAGPVGVGGLDELAFEHVEEPAVVEQVGASLQNQMSPFDEDILATELMDRFCGLAGNGQGPDFKTGETFRFVDVRCYD